MSRMLSPKLIFLAVSVLALSGFAAAQDPFQPGDTKPPASGAPQVKRPNLIQMLGLSPDQLRQVRQMNQQRKPLMEAAGQRLRQANRSLDEAIYADAVDDTQFQAKLKELQLAQAEVARLRFTSELQLRKILTPDQLTRFRDLRRQFQPPPADGNGPGPDQKPMPMRRFRRQMPPNQPK